MTPQVLVQAIVVGILLFVLNVGLPQYPGLSVALGAIVTLGLAIFVGREWAWRVVAALVMVYAAILFTPITNALVETLEVKCSNPRGDAVVVLEGDPGYARIMKGLELFSQGSGPVLVVTGVDGRREGRRHYEIATLFGVSQDRIIRLTTRTGSGTRGEIEALREVPRLEGMRRIVLVTSRTHSLRATRAFEKAGFDVCSAPALDRNELSDSWDPWGRVLMARDLVRELVGFVYYKARGWIR